MKLYIQPGTCSSAVHIALLEAGLDFECVDVRLHEGRGLPGGRALSDVNPKDYVPALELEDGEVLTETIALLPYVASHVKGESIAPEIGSRAWFRMLEWIAYIGSELHKGASAVKWGHPEGREVLLAKLMRRFAFVDEYLKDHEYLVGDRFSVADAHLFVISCWGDFVGFDISGMSNIVSFQKRMMARESVRQAMAAMKG